MKFTLKISKLFVLIAATTLSFSCSDDGKDGIDGTNGTNGETGTANVIYSEWKPRPAGQDFIVDGTSGRAYDYAAPEITQSVLDGALILAYMKYEATNVFTLPYTSSAGGAANTITAIPSLGNLKIFRYRHDGAAFVNLGANVFIRYIIIPGGVAAKQTLDYKNMNYDEVCDRLNIAK